MRKIIEFTKEPNNGLVYNAKGDVSMPNISLGGNSFYADPGSDLTFNITFVGDGTYTYEASGDVSGSQVETGNGTWVDTGTPAELLVEPWDGPSNYQITWGAPTALGGYTLFPSIPTVNKQSAGSTTFTNTASTISFDATSLGPDNILYRATWQCNIVNLGLNGGTSYPFTIDFRGIHNT